jgi:hypothetical protein
VSATEWELKRILAENGVVGDYPMSLGVLAFFRSIIRTWHTTVRRSISTETLVSVEEQVDAAITRMVRRHFVQRSVQHAVFEQTRGNTKDVMVEGWLEECSLSAVFDGLRMLLDFGDDDEVVAAAQLVGRFSEEGGRGVGRLCSSIGYSMCRPSLSSQQRGKMESVLSRIT